MIEKQLGQRISDYRKKMGISQEKLALLSGLDRTYISGIERGKRNPSILSLQKIINVLGINFEDLFKDM